MKDFFIDLFKYDCHSNQQMVEKIIEAGSPEKAVQLMAHLLAAQNIWISRCREFDNQNDVVLWPRLKSINFTPIILNNFDDWQVFVKNLKPNDFDKVINYHATNGDAYSNKLADILFHVINHGTHHRAQIGQMLKNDSKTTLPIADYIYFIRN